MLFDPTILMLIGFVVGACVSLHMLRPAGTINPYRV